MKKIKINLLTNVVLTAVLLVICLTCFLFGNNNVVYTQKEIKAIYHGNKENPSVSLMFNVYENSEIVKKIVDLLNENGFQSTFFVGGCWADDNQETLNYIINNGHEIGNHGYFHKDHKELNYEQNKREILNTEKMVYALCGAKTTLFAPPSGSFSSVTLSVADSLGYKTVMWSKDTIDWRDKDTSLIYKRATEGINNGDMVLMHPKSWTYSALSDILKEIKRKNLKVVKVSELIE